MEGGPLNLEPRKPAARSIEDLQGMMRSLEDHIKMSKKITPKDKAVKERIKYYKDKVKEIKEEIAQLKKEKREKGK